MSDDAPDITPRDAHAIAQRALAKANRVDDLEARLDDVETELAALELRLSELDDDRPYDALTLDEKVGMVREHAFQRAVDGTGQARLDYDDIMWGVFDGEPGAAHCYKLMRKAAAVRGFVERDPADASRHLAVDAAEAKQGAVFLAENNAAAGGGSP